MSRECTSITVAHCFQEPRTDCHARDSCRLPLVHPYVGLLIRALTPQCRSLRVFPGRGHALLAHHHIPPPATMVQLRHHRSRAGVHYNATAATLAAAETHLDPHHPR